MVYHRGDEYDTAFFDKRSKFVHYLPEVAIVNNLEFDHADIFENVGAIQTAFKRFINLIPRNGQLLANGDDANLAPLLERDALPGETFWAWRTKCGARLQRAPRADGIRVRDPEREISHQPRGRVERAQRTRSRGVRETLRVEEQPDPVRVRHLQGHPPAHGNPRIAGGVTIVDDFGHHPTAIRETLRALRIKYPANKVWAVFEPRSNTTRRNVFQSELASAFADA
jgi:UDP-N-acetylmuramate: L-alanyl-gamma-D-glutamyl-meso-diaminopimelate ligase